MNRISVTIDQGALVVCKFKTLCEKRWVDLNKIEGKEKVRYCIDCMKPVFFCTTYEELRIHAKESHCITFVKEILQNLANSLIDAAQSWHAHRHEAKQP